MISPSWVIATTAAAGFLSPLVGLVYSTWLRSKRNERKLDLLLRSVGVDPDAPAYEIGTEELRTDGGGDRDD